jgi:hypothetical protein
MSGYRAPDPPKGVAILEKPFAPETLLNLIEHELNPDPSS